MDKTGSSTLKRQWLILSQLPRGRWMGTAELQQHLQNEGFDTTLRTIQRDLNQLAEQFPLEANGLSPQGWRWKTDSPVMNLPQMTSSQALTFLMVQQHLSQLMPSSVLNELRPWFDSAHRVARHGQSGRSRWLDKVRVVPPQQPLIPPVILADVLHTVQEALLQNRQIDALYQSRSKQERLELILSPIALVQRGPIIYLIATRPGADSVRRFAMHRFKRTWLREDKARAPKGFNLDDYLHRGGMGFGNGNMIHLNAIFTREAGEHLYESRLSKDQAIEELPDGRLRVTATVADTPQLHWWLKALGAEIRERES